MTHENDIFKFTGKQLVGLLKKCCTTINQEAQALLSFLNCLLINYNTETMKQRPIKKKKTLIQKKIEIKHVVGERA